MARSLLSAASLGALVLARDALASELFPRSVKGDGFLSIPVGHVDRPHASNALGRRDPIEADIFNMNTFYTINITLGTPPQSVAVLLDTGSSDLWVSASCTRMPDFPGLTTCDLLGSYSPSRSRTADGPIGEKTLHYGDPTDPDTQTSVTLHYYTDDLVVADATVAAQIFGVVGGAGTRGVQGIAGIFGLAPDMRAGFEEGKPYSLVLNSMVDQGLIRSRAFSLDLRHAESETGAVVYGGLDRAKFAGKLARFPLQPGINGESRLAVSLTSVGTTSRSRQTTHSVDPSSAVAVLDSGTTLSRLHPRLARPLLQELGATVDPNGFFLAPCAVRSTGTTVDFGFGEPRGRPGLVLRVRISDFVLDMPHPANARLCYVGLAVTEHLQILGDSVLRSGYFVFDWDNREVHIAQAANCGTEMMAIGEGKGAVPRVEGKCVLDASGRPTMAPTPTVPRDAASPTTPYTTTYTVSECPPIDHLCTPGMVTTQTFVPLETRDATETRVSDRGLDQDGAEDDKGAGLGRGDLLDVWTVATAGIGVVYVVLRFM